MMRVVVADDHALVRVDCRTLLEAEADIEVVAEADSGGAAVAAVRATRPDVVLMDVRMPGLDGSRPRAGSRPTLAWRASGS